MAVRRSSPLLLLLAVAIVQASAAAQNGSSFTQWTSSALGKPGEWTPRLACATLVSQTSYNFSITRTTTHAASSEAPAHCQIRGQILPEVQFELSLPTTWNGRLYMFGNGGYAGEALESAGRQTAVRRALTSGFAVAQTNTGHQSSVEPLGTFAASSQKLLDYAFRAVHVTVTTAKQLIRVYYEQPPRFSYFDGCSTGGRQGLISAQRFPDDFDGIVVGAPVLDFVGTMISYQRMQRAFAAAPIDLEKVKILANTIAAKCDASDGVADGVIENPKRCTFAPASDLPVCASEENGSACFTPAQIRTLETVYSSVTRNGNEVFPGWPVGSEAFATDPKGFSSSGWVPWFVGGPKGQPIQSVFGQTFFQNMAFGRPSPTYDWATFDLERDFDKLDAARATLNATDPDLSRFKARGGKILSYFGWADPALNPMMGVKYYEQVSQRFGSETTDFYRLFMVPGMFHCAGGVGVSTFDAMTPLVQWVENNRAPASIVATRIVNEKVLRARPLCPFPEVARYRGSGSVDDAANFACVSP
jgi:hypothetical protein